MTVALAFGLATAAHAQSAYYTFDGKRLADGATITIEAEEDAWGGYSCETNPATDITKGVKFVNATAKALSGKATLTITKDELKPYPIQWCMGGSCQIVNSTPFNKDFTVPANGAIPLQYDAVLDEEDLHYGQMESTIVAKVGSESFTVHIVFTLTDPAHVGAADSQKPVVLEYFTLDGRSCKLQQPRGVSLARFSDGKVRKVTRK